MIITIDFDETLFPTLQRVVEIYNKRHNQTLTLDRITTYDLYESLDPSVADELIDLFCEHEVYINLQPFKNAPRVIKSLIDKGHEVYIATATNVKNLEWKEQLLQKYFPCVPKNNLIRIYKKNLLKTDVLIEDSLNNLTEIFADRICFNQPWNHSTSKDMVYDIHRVNNWSEVPNIINNIEKEMKRWPTR